MPNLSRLPPAMRAGFRRFQPFREDQIAMFKDRKGHKPLTVEDWMSINKKAGVQYRKHKGKHAASRKKKSSRCYKTGVKGHRRRICPPSKSRCYNTRVKRHKRKICP